MTHRNHARRGSAALWIPVILLLMTGGAYALWVRRDSGPGVDPSLLHTVSREDLRISVVESGQLMAAVSEDVTCQVRGSTTIIKLIPEGTFVEPGDLLVELDVSGIEDDLTQQQIKYEQAYAAWVQADEAKGIQLSMNESNIAQGQLTLDLATTDLKKFLKGDKLLQLDKADSDITLAELNRKTLEKTLTETQELVNLKYAAETDLERDLLAYERADADLLISRKERELMKTYDFKRQEQVLQSDKREAGAELERVKRRAKADLAQKEADLKSKQATLDLEKQKLDRLNEQMANAKIYAKTSGMVVYPVNSQGHRGSDRDRVEEGATVRERQLMVSLPDTSQMQVQVQVHESALEKVEKGLAAVVTIDALPDEAFFGKVTFIAPLPDSANQWLNPDLKVYRCVVTLGGDTLHLRPGMSASCEIVVEDLKGALAIPVHAVHQEGRHFYCYVGGPSGPEIRDINIGAHNDRVVAIETGLENGDQVYLAVPPDAPTPDYPDDENEASVEELQQRVESIEASEGAELAWRQENAGGEGAGAGGGFKMPSAADMERYQKMSPEERRQAMEDAMKNMTPEQRESMRGMRRGGGEGGDGGGMDGGGRRGGGEGGGRRGGRGPDSGGNSE